MKYLLLPYKINSSVILKIIFTGKSDFTYNRTSVLLNGLKKLNGIDIIEFPIKSRKNFDTQHFTALSSEADFVYIPPFRHRDVRFIHKYSKAPVVFDPLVSLYLSKVVDYGHWWKAPVKLWQDLLSFRHCEILIAETEENRLYYARKFKIPESSIHCVYIGVDTDIFQPIKNEEDKNTFDIGFYGSFIPLQGIEKIIETANLLKDQDDIRFHLIGSGYGFEKIKKLVKQKKLHQVIFHGWIPHHQLPQAISRFDLCLGIFGTSLKSNCVIPNKIFHYAAMKKCIMTKDSPAIREIFTDRKDIILCKAEADDMASKILDVKKNSIDYQTIENNAFQLISRNYNEISIADRLVSILRAYKEKI